MDRVFRQGQSFDWEGHKLTVDWMPGQTEFAMCLQRVIDGRKVAFTGDSSVTLHLRNFRPSPQTHHVTIMTTAGLEADPQLLEGTLAAEASQGIPLRITAKADAPLGVSIVALDVRLDGHRYGALFDLIVEVE